MGEKIVICIGMTLLILFLPYGLTLLLTGYQKDASQVKKSGIVIEYEESGQLKGMDAEEYMKGILAATVPSDYEEEMFKAQAVITRTNIWKLSQQGKSISATDLQMQYLSETEQKERYGEVGSKELSEKINRSVAETYGQVMTYQGQYIDALYHAVSIGQTASALDVYGKDIAYLTSVDSSSDVEAKEYMNMQMLTYDDVLRGLQNISAQLKSGDNAQSAASQDQAVSAEVAQQLESEFGITKEQYMKQISIAQKSKTGYVQKVSIGTQVVSGEQFRNAFAISSLYFYMEEMEQKLRIVSLGKGHGLGLSQYGGNQMAKQGASYKDILEHYYKGVEIIKK